MTDVHTHVMPFVDDGSDSFENSLALVKLLESEGVDKIILTPHYKKGRYEPTPERLNEEFNNFSKQVSDSGAKVELYLGEEVFCDKGIYELIKQNKILTLNGTQYLLIEFDYFNYTDIADFVFNLKTLGYIPVIAHVERYTYLDVDTLIEIKSQGALIQVNSSSVIGESGKKMQKKVLATIKSGIVDFVSTDIHYKRQSSIKKAYKIVEKKFGKKVAEDLFTNNAKIFNL